MSTLFKCLWSPRLIRTYAQDDKEAVSYVPYGAEKLGDNVIQLTNRLLQFGVYISPFLIWVLYKRNYLSPDGMYSLSKLTVFCCSICATSLVARAVGRAGRPEYTDFIKNLESVRRNYNSETKNILSRYDFDFWAWPLEFSWREVEKDSDKPRLYIDEVRGSRSITEWARALPCQLIAYLVANSIGIRLLYPGTLMQYFISPHLIDGRGRLIEEHRGRRLKLEARDGNFIDAMIVDRRGRPEFANGDMLVICCEGNAGFYEVGMAVTPLEAGYSVLGWNHPGFGGSTGSPFPRQEMNAADVVMQYALNRLEFPPERIIVYGWSIGGFTASWTAMNYPNVRAVILDATFDHVLPLAANVMPVSWKPLVAATIKHQLNLSVADQIVKYPGPIRLFRRSRDEIISLEPGSLTSNRGNDLLLKVLKFRFPNVVDEVTAPVLRDWMAADPTERQSLLTRHDVVDATCCRQLQTFIAQHSNSFPMTELGRDFTEREKTQMTLHLAGRYMVDFDSNHCTPLPAHLFFAPNHIGLESDCDE